MKVAVLGDAHANLAALEAVVDHVERWKPDVVVSAGDMINRGPSSAPCLCIVEARRRNAGWLTLRGNHEDYVIHQSTPQAARSGPEFEAFLQSYWTFTKIGGDVGGIKGWSDKVEVAGPDGSRLRFAHASVLGNRRGIFPTSPDEDLIERAGEPRPAVFCAGHTHTAFIRRLGGTLYVNAGSVGLPFDRDLRAGYARLTWRSGAWDAEIVRLGYNRERTLDEYRKSGFLSEAGPIAWLVLAEYLNACSQLYAWHRDYFAAVMSGERDIESTVREQLESQSMWGDVSAYL